MLPDVRQHYAIKIKALLSPTEKVPYQQQDFAIAVLL
jgi:hypothetical protein